MIKHPYSQGTPEWRAARRGVITGSRASDVRRADGLTAQQRTYVDALQRGVSESEAKFIAGYKKAPTSDSITQALAGTLRLQFSDAAHTYARQLARERCGGQEPEGFEGMAQRIGHEEEQFAAIEYMAQTGASLEEAFFITTDDGKFGCSLDRWVDRPAGVPFGKKATEFKTMVSSATLFRALVEGDISEYRDQCIFALWLLSLDWIDLGLWCPDLQCLRVIRIERDEDEIQRLEDDLMAFDGLVSQYEGQLRARLGASAPAPTAAPRPVSPTTPTRTGAAPVALPESIF